MVLLHHRKLIRWFYAKRIDRQVQQPKRKILSLLYDFVYSYIVTTILIEMHPKWHHQLWPNVHAAKSFLFLSFPTLLPHMKKCSLEKFNDKDADHNNQMSQQTKHTVSYECSMCKTPLSNSCLLYTSPSPRDSR